MEVKCFIVLERKCALREGRKQLLENRNNELRCDDPVEAEAISMETAYLMLSLLRNVVDMTGRYKGDFYSGSSLDLNEYHILRCAKGNLYSAPLSGVGVQDRMNSNLSSGSLSDTISKEFELDNLKINTILISTEGTGEINIDSEEL